MLKIKQILSSRSILILIAVIIAFIPLFIWPYGEDYFYYPKISIIYFLLLIAILICILSLKKKYIKFSFPKIMIPFTLFIIFVTLSAVFSPFTEQAFFGKELRNEGAFAYIAYFLILYFSYLSIERKMDVKRILTLLLCSASLISIYGILQYLGIDPVKRDSIRSSASWVFSSFSTLGNPDFLGSYLSIVFPLALCLYVKEDKRKSTAFLYIVTVLLYSALICTKARSAWVGVALSLFFITVFFYKFVLRKILKISILLVVLIIVTCVLNNVHNGAISTKFQSLVGDYKAVAENTKDKYTAGSQRIFIWSRTMKYIFDMPLLGSGPDTFDRVFKMSPKEAEVHFGSQGVYVDKAHNEYLQISITMGLPALALYLIFLCSIIIKSIRNIARGSYDIYTVCLLSGALAYMAQAFFNISVVSTAPVYWAILGLLIRVNEDRKIGHTA